MKIFYLLWAMAAGIMMPVQAGVNALLGAQLRSPVMAAFISFFIGALFLAAVCLALRTPMPGINLLSRLPLWMWTGGILGAFFVTTTIILAPKLGAVTLLASLITAQMAASLILDHFGLIGYPVQPVSIWRVAGVLFLILGVVLVQKY
ncbi:DMT family transporter [Desulfonatronovibrio magnus]|uniref:DMT family transporter n=1 Tax=Desulfonatronovibrio magnus TaxID=698827 RepID=UPI0005EB1C20|nr:DMT family transporter [Desulfonatronovibrio magnus]RQD59751.1 MAG: DMT family transporter [Desulfonatronovibrio sp. MSAO_Bac4]